MNTTQNTIAKRNAIRRLLWRWGRVEAYCQARQREMAAFKETLDAACDISPGPLDGMPHGQGRPSDPTSIAACNLAGMIDMLKDQIEIIAGQVSREIEFLRAMDEAVGALPYAQQNIVRMRYKECLGWEYIAYRNAYATSWAKAIEGQAVDALAGKIDVKTIQN